MRSLFSAFFLLTGSALCQDTSSWYSGLRSLLNNCPTSGSWRQREFLEEFRKCVQKRAVSLLDSFLDDDVIPVVRGIDLVRYRGEDGRSLFGTDENASWPEIIFTRLTRVLKTHVFKIDMDKMKESTGTSGQDGGSTVVEGRRRQRRRHHHVTSFMMMGLLLMGSILIPMGFQFLAVLGGKALILAKMALILSSIQGLKKIATNGVNYGLYHSPMDGWHDRSHQETSGHIELSYPEYHPY